MENELLNLFYVESCTITNSMVVVSLKTELPDMLIVYDEAKIEEMRDIVQKHKEGKVDYYITVALGNLRITFFCKEEIQNNFLNFLKQKTELICTTNISKLLHYINGMLQ